MGTQVRTTPVAPVRSRRTTKGRTAELGEEASAGRRTRWTRLGMYAALLLLLYFGTDAFYRWSLTSPYFRVRSVTVTGVGHLTQSVVKARLDLKSSDNLLAVDLDVLREKIESHPWVRSASLSRDLPDTLLVEVVERRPSVAVMPPDRKIHYLLDGEGVILGEVGAGPQIFPVLRGIGSKRASRKLTIGQTLSGEQLQTGLAAVGAFRTLWPANRKGKVRLVAVRLKDFPARRMISMDVLGPQEQPVRLRLDPGKVDEALKQFSALVRHWNGKPWPGEVDLSMGSQVVVRSPTDQREGSR